MPSSDHGLNAGADPKPQLRAHVTHQVWGASPSLCASVGGRSRRVKSLAGVFLFKDIPRHVCRSIRAPVAPSGTGLLSQGTFLAAWQQNTEAFHPLLPARKGPGCSCYPHIFILTLLGKKKKRNFWMAALGLVAFRIAPEFWWARNVRPSQRKKSLLWMALWKTWVQSDSQKKLLQSSPTPDDIGC